MNRIRGLEDVELPAGPEFEDKERVCRECNTPWTCTAGEQQFLHEKFGKDFKLPGKCLPCRRKARGG
jgi:hypothetical protein